MTHKQHWVKWKAVKLDNKQLSQWKIWWPDSQHWSKPAKDPVRNKYCSKICIIITQFQFLFIIHYENDLSLLWVVKEEANVQRGPWLHFPENQGFRWELNTQLSDVCCLVLSEIGVESKLTGTYMDGLQHVGYNILYELVFYLFVLLL